MKKQILFLACLIMHVCAWSQKPYFPPLTGTAWETVSLDSLGWCPDKLDSLYTFLSVNNTKGFIVLRDGKIAIEKYFGTFTKDSIWYWASAAKTLTAVLVGKAYEEGKLKLTDSSSKYIGKGWTICTPAQEGKITIWHQLTMTSGLDDEKPADTHCTFDSCLLFKANPGSRWAYHNAPYTLLDSVIRVATGQTLAAYTNATVRNRIGMNGLWFRFDYDNTYLSNARSMARFGLLAQNNFVWNTDTLLKDTTYRWQMVNTSQQLNKSYGYLWWLNGKSSYMVPTLQTVFPGSYAPEAPDDMFAAIGKNGQVASISRSKGLVVIRMGDAPGTGVEVPTEFTNQIWKNLNKVMCAKGTFLSENNYPLKVSIYPNPTQNELMVQLPNEAIADDVKVYSLQGKLLRAVTQTNQVSLNDIPSGLYCVEVIYHNQSKVIKFIKQ